MAYKYSTHIYSHKHTAHKAMNDKENTLIKVIVDAVSPGGAVVFGGFVGVPSGASLQRCVVHVDRQSIRLSVSVHSLGLFEKSSQPRAKDCIRSVPEMMYSDFDV